MTSIPNKTVWFELLLSLQLKILMFFLFVEKPSKLDSANQ